jgi:agmatinase
VVELVGLCYEGVDHLVRGASVAPSALRVGLQTAEDESVLLGTSIPEVKDHGDLPLQHLFPDEALRIARDFLKEKLNPTLPFLILGGDHTVTYFALDYLLEIGYSPHVLHLDAHLDRRIEYKGVKLGHATVMHHCAQLLGPGKILSFGIRTRAHDEVVEENSTFFYSVMDPLERALSNHPGERFYLTLDLDVLDPSAFPAVGYPEPAGISFQELFSCIKLLKGRLLGADIVEYIPFRDPGGIYAQVAGIILRELLIVLESSRE